MPNDPMSHRDRAALTPAFSFSQMSSHIMHMPSAELPDQDSSFPPNTFTLAGISCFPLQGQPSLPWGDGCWGLPISPCCLLRSRSLVLVLLSVTPA